MMVSLSHAPDREVVFVRASSGVRKADADFGAFSNLLFWGTNPPNQSNATAPPWSVNCPRFLPAASILNEVDHGSLCGFIVSICPLLGGIDYKTHLTPTITASTKNRS